MEPWSASCAPIPTLAAELVDQVVARYHHEYDGRPIREFVPILVERDAFDHLKLEATRTHELPARV